MSTQAGCLPKVDVGTPAPTFIHQEWEVIEVQFHGFENLTAAKGERVYSPEFTCVGHRWRLKLYPGGVNNSDDGMVALFLEYRSDESITADYFLGTKRRDAYRKTLLPRRGNASGWNNFQQRTKIIADLVEGSLNIVVRLRKSETPASIPMPFIAGNPFPTSILAKFMDEKSSDIAFDVGGHKVENCLKRAKTSSLFYAHRLMVQDWTVDLDKLCKDPQNPNIAFLPYDKPDIIRHLLYYSYGGKIDENELEENAKEIIDTADKYGVVGLKLEAEATFVTSTTITIENVMDNLLYADSKNCALLKEAVMDFIVENGKESIKKLSFDNFPGHLVKDLLTAVHWRDEKSNVSCDANDLSTLRVNALRKMLHEKGLCIDGSREMMIARLEDNVSN